MEDSIYAFQGRTEFLQYACKWHDETVSLVGVYEYVTPLYTQDQYDQATSRQQLALHCEQCGDSFTRSKKDIRETLVSLKPERQQMGRFCSAACKRDHFFPHNATCAECGTSFRRAETEIAKVERTFCSQRCSATFYNRQKWGELRKGRVPIQRCKGNRTTYISWEIRKPRPSKPIRHCQTCGNETKNHSYCNGTCRNRALNKLIKGSRSKAERVLTTALHEAYPDWTISENDRTVLNGLELDIYIPEIRLAIEWNGVFHYEPIHGIGHLDKIMKKDNIKIEKCREIGVELIIICDRTSHDAFIRETVAALIEQLRPLYKAHPV